MQATFDMSAYSALGQSRARPFYAAVVAGLACAFLIGKAAPVMMDAVSTAIAPLCASSDPAGSALDLPSPPFSCFDDLGSDRWYNV